MCSFFTCTLHVHHAKVSVVVNMSTSTGYQDRARHTELKVHLIRLGKSQQVLARALKVSRQYLNQVLMGHKPGLHVRARLVELGIPANLISHPPPPVKPNKKRAA